MHKPLRLALLIAAIYSGGVLAQAKVLDIPAQSLAGALTALASQSGIQLLFNADELKGARAPALHGNLAPEAALRQLLEGSGFSFANTGKGTFVVQKRAAASGEHVLTEVLVTADAERGYKPEKATIAGKVPLSLREIPNSVSVVTRQQMDEQGMVTVSDALNQTTGITVIANDTTNDQILSRGYSLSAVYDGVPSYNGLSATQQFDLALYERVEILRGPAGLLQGSGNPGGVVNMVRKRAKDQFAVSGTLAAGSWENYRMEADVTGPLNEARTLRARAVVTEQDRKYFYDKTHTKKWLAFGALEYDLQPQTTVSLSASIQDSDTQAPSSGVPLYTDYSFINLDRSTNVYPYWVNYSIQTQEVSLAGEHRFDNKWLAKIVLNHRNQRSTYKDAWPGTGVNPVNMTMDSYSRSLYAYNNDRDGADAYVTGPFSLFGRNHNLLLGFNYDRYLSNYKSASPGSVANVVLGTEDSVVAEPFMNYNSGSESQTTQYGSYGQLRLSLADPLTLVLGGRLTTFKTKNRNVAPSAQTAWGNGNAKADNHFSPYGGLIYDLTKQVNLYASYSDIFVPQTNKKADGSIIDPRTGRQYEVGSKGEFFDGKLGVSVAVFNIRDKNRAYRDPAYPSSSNFYLSAGEIESKGWEAEITGSPLPGLDLTAGYTRLMTKYLKDRNNEGKDYSIQSPNHQFKLWANYRFSEPNLQGLQLGGGVLANSGIGSSRGNYQVNQGEVAIFNARLAYQIDKHYSLSLAANNLFDKKYYASVGTATAYTFYGEPRSYMLTLRASY